MVSVVASTTCGLWNVLFNVRRHHKPNQKLVAHWFQFGDRKYFCDIEVFCLYVLISLPGCHDVLWCLALIHPSIDRLGKKERRAVKICIFLQKSAQIYPTRCWGCFQGVINFTTRIIYKSIKWWYTTSADLNSQEDIFASCRSTGSIPEETLHQQWPEVFNTVQARFEMNFANLEKAL